MTKDTTSTGRFLTTGLLAGCALLFAAASCDSQKKQPDPPTAAVTVNQTTRLVETPQGDDELAPEVFVEKKPEDLGPPAPAIFALAGLKGYTEPCGCTLDVMLGGIDRIAAYVEDARKLYPEVHVVDAGDLLFEKVELEATEIPQEKARVDVVTTGIADIGVAVTVPGETDFALGTEYYETKVAAAKVKPIAANLTIAGRELPASHEAKLQEIEVLYVGIADPKLYEGIEGVKVTAPKPALDALKKEIAAADATVLLVHGDISFAKEMLEASPQADFAVVGHAPRETDQVDVAGGGFTLEPYDQGRYLGILKLYNAAGAADASFTNVRQGSKAELEKVERQIEHVNKSINSLPPSTPGKEPAVLVTLRKRLERLKERAEELQNTDLDVPEDKPAFLWRTVAMDPSFRLDPEVRKVREAFNLQLRELNSSIEFTIPEVAPGQPEFVGTDICASCHSAAKVFWDETAHSRAMETLEKRNKDFDQNCVGCHVVGWEQPGGSVLGKLHYEGEIEGPNGPVPVKKNLADVGCEACHGPGSQHFLAPTDAKGQPQNIIRDPGIEQCQQCHVPEHSPRFDFATYVQQITGEGHARGE